MSKTHLTCLHCGRDPEPGIDRHAVRFICSTCTEKAMHPHGRSLRFPHDEQDEMFLTTIPQSALPDPQ